MATIREWVMRGLRKVLRLVRIESRFEAWLVIYAIAVGAIERGRFYVGMYPGWSGWLLALACTAVVFVAGGKLLDSVRPRAGVDRRRAAPVRIEQGVNEMISVQ